MTISSDPIHRLGASSAASADSDASVTLSAIRSVAATSPEAALALASLTVEESADRARASRQQERQIRSAYQRAAIGKKRQAANYQMAQSIVSTTATVASTAVGTFGPSQSTPAGGTQPTTGTAMGKSAIDGAGQIGGAVLGRLAVGAEIQAETRSQAANEASERSEMAGDDAERLQRHAQKMQQGAEEVQRLRHQAQMTALRG